MSEVIDQVQSTGNLEAQQTSPAPEAVAPAVATSAEGIKHLLPEDLQGSKSLEAFKTVGDLAKSYEHLNGLLGKRMQDMSPEDLNSYYAKLGRPESADQYSLPEYGAAEMSQWFKGEAHKLGLSQEQARGLFESYAEMERSALDRQAAQMDSMREEAVKTLRSEFGPAFEERVTLAQTALKEFGSEGLVAYLDETGLGNHPELVKAFAKIGKELREDSMLKSDFQSTFGVTPDEAKSKISALKSDKEFMAKYMRKQAPGHAEAVAEMEKLFNIMHNS